MIGEYSTKRHYPKDFCSNLNMEDITDAYYRHGQ